MNRSGFARLCVLLAVASVFAVVNAQEETSWESLMEKVQEAREEGDTQGALERAKQALEFAEAKFGPTHANVAKSLVALAEAHHALGQIADADPVSKRALSTIEKAVGAQDPALAEISERIGLLYLNAGNHAEAERLFERALGIREKAGGKDEAVLVTVLRSLAQARQGQRKLQEAESLYLRAVGLGKKAFGDSDPRVAAVLRDLSELTRQLGRLPEAEQYQRQAQKIEETTLEGADANKVQALFNQAALKRQQGKAAEAQALLEELTGLFEQSGNTEHPDYVRSLGDLADTLIVQRKSAEAEPHLRKAVEVAERTLGTGHAMVGKLMLLLGDVYRDQGKMAEGRALMTKGVAITEKALGVNHLAVVQSKTGLATSAHDEGNYEEAEKLYREILVGMEKHLGPEHSNLLTPLEGLAQIAKQQGKLADAERLYKRALGIAQKTMSPDNPAALSLLYELSKVYQAQNKNAEAQAFLDQAMELSRGSGTAQESSLLRNEGLSHLQKGEFGTAERLLRDALRLAEKLPGDNPHELGYALFELVVMFIAQGKESDAEELLTRLRVIEKKAGAPIVQPDRYMGMATFLTQRGKQAQAEKLMEQALAMVPDERLAADASVAALASALADLYINSGKLDKARALQTKLLAAKGKSGAAAPTPTGEAPVWLQSALTEVKLLVGEQKYAQAEQKAKEALARVKAEKLQQTPGIAFKFALWSLTSQLARSLAEQGKYAQAEERLKEALAQVEAEKVQDTAVKNLLWGLTGQLAVTLMAQGRESEAVGMLEQALATLPAESFGNPEISMHVLILVDIYMRSGKQDKGQALYAKVAAARKLPGAGPSSTMPAEARQSPLALGGEAQVLISQKKYAEAEALLVEKLRQAKTQGQMPPPDLQFLLAEVYRAQRKTKEAKSAYQEWVSFVEKRVASGQPAPRAGQIYQSYADFLKEIGETEEAKKYAEKARSARGGGR